MKPTTRSRTLRALTVGAALLWAAAGRGVHADERPLLWAADESGGAPYVLQDPRNADQVVGFEVDLKDALQQELGRPIQFKHYDFKSLIPGLQRGDFDFAMNGLEVLPEYQKVALFSRPYYVYKLQLAVRKDERRFAKVEELKDLGVAVGTLTGSSAERSLMRRGVNPPLLHSYDDQTGMYIDLKNGAVDAVYIDLPIHSYYLPKFPGLELTGEPGEKGYYAIAFRKEDGALCDQFNAALGRLIDGDKLRPIYQKWDVWTDDQKELGQPASLTTGAASAGGYLWYLLGGAVVTVELSVLGMLLAVALGMPIALARLYGPAPVRWLAVAYVEFFRGIPVLLLLFFMYFVLTPVLDRYIHSVLGLKFHVDAFWTAVLGFGLNYAAYEAEIYRAAIGAVPAGQWEAAASLGMSRALTFRRVILPQALRIILPPMTSDFVALFKDTSVVSVIAVAELTKRYQTAALSSLNYVEIGLATAALYLIMSVPLGFLSRWLEQRWGKGIQEMTDAIQSGPSLHAPRSGDMRIEVTNLAKQYGGRQVLTGVNLTVAAGETVALIGPSGGGKSTLLRCLNGLNSFDGGSIRVGPHLLTAAESGRSTPAVARVRRLLGMIFQDFQLFPHLTALGNVVEAPVQVLGRGRAEAEKHALQLLTRVGLAGHSHAYPNQLSGGQKQRVAIARALAMEPRGLLCDEITSALDPELKCEVLDVLVDLKRDGLTLLLVTHEIGFARRAAERVVVLADGGIVEEGPPGEVIDRPRTERTKQFLSRVLG